MAFHASLLDSIAREEKIMLPACRTTGDLYELPPFALTPYDIEGGSVSKVEIDENNIL